MIELFGIILFLWVGASVLHPILPPVKAYKPGRDRY